MKLHGSLPKEFSNRKPKKPKHILKSWKAHDFRQFLLYTGPVVLKNILSEELYHYFLKLHVSISILVNPSFCKEENYIKYADNLLKSFVKISEEKYGLSFMSHNVHNLLHLCNDVRKFGPLDKFSSFPFENKIGKIKTLFRKAV